MLRVIAAQMLSRQILVLAGASVLGQALTGGLKTVTSTVILEMLLSRGADPNSNTFGDEVPL